MWGWFPKLTAALGGWKLTVGRLPGSPCGVSQTQGAGLSPTLHPTHACPAEGPPSPFALALHSCARKWGLPRRTQFGTCLASCS